MALYIYIYKEKKRKEEKEKEKMNKPLKLMITESQKVEAGSFLRNRTPRP